MKKKNTIKKYREFKEILNIRNFKRNSLFTIYYRGNTQNKTRIGLLVSKKNGNSVTRNKIKRQIREVIQNSIDYTQSIDLIVVISKNYDVNSFEKNSLLLKNLLNDILYEEMKWTKKQKKLYL